MIIPKNLLIVRTDRIGDVVLSLPLAGIIKKHYPGCKITFLIRSYTKSLVENNPAIDNIIILHEANNKPSVRDNVKEISSYSFDAAIVVSPSFIVTLIIFLSRIKFRIGTGYRWYSFLFNKKVFVHRKYAEKHELEFNVDLLKNFGINENLSTGDVRYNLFPVKGSKEHVEKELEINNILNGKPIVIVHPGSGGSAVDLPVDKFRALIDSVVSNLDVNVIVTGSESEKDLCEKLITGEKVKNFAGRFNLSDLIALIDKADLFISNSTGPIHIAAALGKYVIGFYPKILSCSPQRWGPYTKNKFVFLPEINCTGCTREQCERLDCMNSIDIKKVFKKVEEICNDIRKKE